MKNTASMSDFINAENGYKGEERTRALLSDYFWILTRSVDADSADVIVQERITSASEAIAKRSRSVGLGYVQSKFFEGTNQVKIHRSYVDDPEHPYRKGYYAFLHCNDDQGEHVYYFFTALDIQEHWYLNHTKDYYCFSITKKRRYENFRNLGRNRVKETVLEGIRELRSSIESLIWRGFIAARADTRTIGENPGEYILTRPYRCPTVIYKHGGQVAPLPPRIDVVPTLAHFEWGYYGSGPMLLAASILVHFMGGDIPTRDEIIAIKDYLIARLEQSETTDHVITAAMLINALCYIPYPCEKDDLQESIKITFAEHAERYSKYL